MYLKRARLRWGDATPVFEEPAISDCNERQSRWKKRGHPESGSPRADGSKQQRHAQLAGVMRAETLDVVELGHIHANGSELGVRDGSVSVLPFLDGHQASMNPLPQEVHRHVGKRRGHHLIESIRGAAAQIVGKVARHRFHTDAPANFLTESFADVYLFAMAVRIRVAVFLDAAALPNGTLGSDHQRIAAGFIFAILGKKLDEPLKIEFHLGDDAAYGGHIGRVESGAARISAENAKHANPLVRAQRCTLAGDGFFGACNGRGKPDTILGTADIVIHRFRNTDHADTPPLPHVCKTERIVAADDD